MPKGTLLFIHGTGDRLRELEPFTANLAERIEENGINYSLQTAIWGDAIGSEFAGKSLPDPPDEPSNNERADYAEWSFFAADPLFGLRLLALPDLDAKQDSGMLTKHSTRAAIVTTNLPFSEWTQVIPNARLCKALLDRITDQAHILETGKESYRFRRTLERRKGKELKN